MTFQIRKALPSPLELEYARMKKESTDERRLPWRRSGGMQKDGLASGQADTVTLSSDQSDTAENRKLKRSQPVTRAEMQALKALFSVRA